MKNSAVIAFLLVILFSPISFKSTSLLAQVEVEDDSGYSETEAEEPNIETPDVEVTLDKSKSDKKTIIRTVQKSDSLQRILSNHGFTVDDSFEFLAMPNWPKHYTLVPGTRYLVSTSKTDSAFAELIFFIPRNSQVLRLTKKNGQNDLAITDFKFEERIKRVEGEVQGSIYSSIRSKVPDAWVTTRFMDAYSLDYKLDKQVRRGAKFVVTYEEKLLNGQYVAPGEVLFTSIEVDGAKQDRFFVKAGDGGGLFIAVDADHDIRPFYSPLEYLHISSPFNMRRFHPIRRRRIPHRGSDFALTHGSPVLAADSGRVARMGRNKAAGIFVVLEHKNGYFTEYVHMSAIEPNIRAGSEVIAGQRVGNVGCTGYCTKPHLHFGIRKGTEHVDPIKLMRPYTVHQQDRVKEFTHCVQNKKNKPEDCAESSK